VSIVFEINNMMKIYIYLALLFSFFINPAISMQQDLPVSEANFSSTEMAADIELNEEVFAEFYTTVFPLLIAWNLAHEYTLKNELAGDDYSDFDFIDLFKATVPGNPYRHPSPDKVEFMPTNAKKWAYSLEGWQDALNFQKLFLNLKHEV
jgi:hypothetical protein